MQESLLTVQQVLSASYRVERELGAGGMATVYLAHDPKHERPVAIKVLRPELAAILGGERFLKEIRLTANLQHPHILPLHDSGQVDSLVYYVMPYVEGESLRDRLHREKQLPVEEAVRIAREVADALDYAHRHGVVHRDIKPENILLHDGRALVADFGIALAVSSTGGTRMTETGMSLGTPQYMSPEQAMGEREITPKSDVYALGCVLYEMLLGEPPFTGPTAQSIVAKVMTEDPRPITLHRRSVPPHIEGAVMRSLSKLPADRFASAAEFSHALTHADTVPVVPTRAMPAVRAPGRPALMFGVAAVLLVALGAAAGRLTRRPAEPPPVARFSVTTGDDNRLSGSPLGIVSLSNDGQTLVYSGVSSAGAQLFLRRMSELTATPIPGTENGSGPSISPDGNALFFIAGTTIKRMPLTGGSAVAVPMPAGVLAASWLDNSRIALAMPNGSLAVLGDNGTTELVAADSSLPNVLLPLELLPDGRALLAIQAGTGGLVGGLIAIDTRSGERTRLVTGNIAGAGYANGALAWITGDGVVLGAPFDPGALRVTGTTVTLAQNVRVAPGGAPAVAFSRSGSLVYVPQLPFDLALLDRAGRMTSLLDVQRRFHSPRVSDDGRRIAVDFTLAGSRDVWVVDRAQRTLTRATFDNDGHDPVWLPGGRRLAYATARAGVIGAFMKDPDGSGAAESLRVDTAALNVAAAFTRDGRMAIVQSASSQGDWDILTQDLTGTRSVTRLLATPFNEYYPALSPDGRWLAYVSDESGSDEVYVRAFPGPGPRTLVSRRGGSEPVWARRGLELFYREFSDRGAPLVSAILRASPELTVVSRTPLFDAADYEIAAPHANYDVTPDGRFVMVHQGRVSEMILIQNWPEEVRRRAAASGR